MMHEVNRYFKQNIVIISLSNSYFLSNLSKNHHFPFTLTNLENEISQNVKGRKSSAALTVIS